MSFHVADTEESLVWAVIQLLRVCDADVLVGYDVQKGSVGYLTERAAELGIKFLRYGDGDGGGGV